MKNKLYIAYFYNKENERDASNYVGKTGTVSEFIKYAKFQGWDIDKDDIDIYEVKQEEDNQGNVYLIETNITLK